MPIHQASTQLKPITFGSSHIITMLLFSLLTLCGATQTSAQKGNTKSARSYIPLDAGWRTMANDTNLRAGEGFQDLKFDDSRWQKVSVPHTWDKYEGYRRILAGNRHGTAWYRKGFRVNQPRNGKQFFLYFEGVGSYATVWLNGKLIGKHAGGRTTFTLNATGAIYTDNRLNTLSVKAEHPPGIRDLPWVDGGSSAERGFSEGSQPMGIFRPVQLLITNEVKVEPFGVHIWNDEKVLKGSALLHLNTELKNYSTKPRQVVLVSNLLDRQGKLVAKAENKIVLRAGTLIEIPQQLMVKDPELWAPQHPYLYTLQTQIITKGQTGSEVIDDVETPYGVRTISWPIGNAASQKRFMINGEPLFINGIAEYEHLIGNSHAFSAAQIRSRVMQMKDAGFNAFRDAHQPHNLRYMNWWDELGILCWTQMAAHIWFDTPEFRTNFKTLLKEWVKERRNSPSVVLWGLENESTLPEDFAKECTEIIRQMDPTASAQRKVTTCNGGKGTDWDVPQNWTGTYGGDPNDYGKDLERQVLVGEYGAWRTLGLHTEGPFVEGGVFSEDRMAQLMETKIRLAEEAREKTAGHFFWLFNSHDNPGRIQAGEGFRELDRIGPVNYKGLLTPWEEPLDVYYLYRANYAPQSSPMVYINSHTWPNRWLKPGMKDSISVYSNCDEVELFNDMGTSSLGRLKNRGRGTHFQWDNAETKYNVLYAVGYIAGKAVAKDTLVLNFLPKAPHFNDLYHNVKATAPEEGYEYLYRVNAGGANYKDTRGNLWMADRQRRGTEDWGSTSWAAEFKGVPSFYASQRQTTDPIRGTRDWELFQSFRYGRDKLKFEFPVPDGEYLVELYFTEPWYGTGGGTDCSGYRLFDVAINDNVVLRDLDIWKEAGHDGALIKKVYASVKGGELRISFPEVKSGQAIISAIAIASKVKGIKVAPEPSPLAQIIHQDGRAEALQTWMDTGSEFSALPPELYGADWTKIADSKLAGLKVSQDADVFITSGSEKMHTPTGYEATGTYISDSEGKKLAVYKKRWKAGDQGPLPLENDQHSIRFIAVNHINGLTPAYDLKKAVNYPAIPAFAASKNVVKHVLTGKERLKFNAADNGVIEFLIQVGVADTYSLNLKYHNPAEKEATIRLEVVAADGTVMKKPETIKLPQTKTGKWSYLNSSTGTMINAGAYKVRIYASDARDLSIDWLEVQ